jgi:hypothetical protein
MVARGCQTRQNCKIFVLRCSTKMGIQTTLDVRVTKQIECERTIRLGCDPESQRGAERCRCHENPCGRLTTLQLNPHAATLCVVSCSNPCTWLQSLMQTQGASSGNVTFRQKTPQNLYVMTSEVGEVESHNVLWLMRSSAGRSSHRAISNLNLRDCLAIRDYTATFFFLTSLH